MKRRKGWEDQSEPSPEGDEWVECGGQQIWAAGFTEGGFPYGITEDEFREASARYCPEAGWARAKRILETVVRQRADPRATVDVGYVKKVGHGLSRDVFAAEVEITTRSEGGTGLRRSRYGREVVKIAVLLPRPDCDPDIDERTRKEARLLGDLATIGFSFRIPRIFGVCPDAGHLALIRSFESGIELDLRADRTIRPWETVGRIAAAIHQVAADRLPWLEPRYATRRNHAQAAMRELDEMTEPVVADARAWIAEHLPPPGPSTLLHGDLLGHNILRGLNEPDTVIDWEYAQLGDPAYDLAIVTRGVRRPFQIEGGMDRLLDTYTRSGGVEVTPAHVHIHELALAARWYRDAVREAVSGEKGDQRAQCLLFLRSLLNRASTAAS